MNSLHALEDATHGFLHLRVQMDGINYFDIVIPLRDNPNTVTNLFEVVPEALSSVPSHQQQPAVHVEGNTKAPQENTLQLLLLSTYSLLPQSHKESVDRRVARYEDPIVGPPLREQIAPCILCRGKVPVANGVYEAPIYLLRKWPVLVASP